jgi:uncharacterized protein (DUF302 family)
VSITLNKINRRRFLSQTITSCVLGLLPIKTFKIMAPKGIVVRPSSYSVKETINGLQAFLLEHGATIYARIDQQSEANKAGQNLLPLEFLLFGNPKAGGPAMAKNPLVALDLPLKVIAWEDAHHQVWVAYNDAEYITERYSLSPNLHSPFALDGVIDSILKKG